VTPLVKRGRLHHTGRPPRVGVCGGGLCGGKRTPGTGQTQAVDAYLRPCDAYPHHFDAYPRPKTAKKQRYTYVMFPPFSEANLCVKIDFGQRYGSEEAAWFTINMIELWAITCVNRGKFMRQFWRINESNDTHLLLGKGR
jgi:hypothetical protein